jgi:predicted nucleic acid-binding protein
LCGFVTITPEIAQEYGEPLPEWIVISSAKNTETMRTIQEILDMGESSAIALAFETENALLILDDKHARQFAKNLGLNVTGTLGILISACQNGIIKDIQEINTIIAKLRAINFHIPSDAEKYFH